LSTLAAGVNIPVFKAYAKNGNVISTKLTVDESYMSFVNMRPETQTLSTAANRLHAVEDEKLAFINILPKVITAIEEWIKNPPLEDRSESREYKQNIHDPYRRGQDEINRREGLNRPKLKELTIGWEAHVKNLRVKLRSILEGFDNKSDLIASILAVYEINTKTSGRPTIKVEDDADAMRHLLNLFESLYNYAHKLSIKTYPNFALSMDSDVLNSPCVLLSQTPHIKTSNGDMSLEVGRKQFDKLLTGVYSIVGFNHTISNGKASSEFSIVKHKSSNMNKEDILPPTQEEEAPSWTTTKGFFR